MEMNNYDNKWMKEWLFDLVTCTDICCQESSIYISSKNVHLFCVFKIQML